MLKKVGAIAAVTAVFAVVVSTTAWGSAKTPAIAKAATASVKCGKQYTIGVAYPATGPAASIGAFQWDWAQFAAKQWAKTHHTTLKLIAGDTQLGGTNPQAVNVAHTFASNGSILGLVGPAGSQEVQDSIAVYQGGGLAAVSGSATRVELTRGLPGNPRETPKGYFYRTVPNDGQQGDRVAYWIHAKLHAKRVYIIDDEEAYSTGLATQVKNDLKKYGGITIGVNHVSQQTSDFSSVITSIPSNTQVVYIPWQLANQAEDFFQQLRAAGKSAIVFGSDGTDAPGTFEPKGGGYVSGFPVDFSSSTLKAFEKAHKGNGETFGLPTYTAVWVDAVAITKACAAGHGSTTRTAVRKEIPKVQLSSKLSLLGFKVHFLTGNSTTSKYQGNGDMGGAANFAVYQVLANGNYKRVG